MFAALEQKKFIDWFVENIFQPSNEYIKVFARESPELKARLRFLCYRGLREATADFWEFDKKILRTPVDFKGGTVLYVNHPECLPQIKRVYNFFRYEGSIEEKVKQQLLKDGNVKPYLSGGRPESIFELSDFEANCENAALLLWSRYVNKLGVLAGEPEDETWTSK